VLLCLLLYNERKDYDDLIGALSRRQKVICVERILEQKNTNKLLERKEREKREKEERAVRRKRSAKKKDEKTRSRHSLCEEVSLKIKKKEVLFYRQTVVKLFHQHATFYPLSSSPEHTHPTTPNKYTQEE
jgi:hypothetical protein